MKAPTPTNAELAILKVLWRDGPSTVRQVHEAVYEGGEVGYTGALKLMQNMLAKGLVTRRSEARQHVYAAKVAEQPVLNQIVRNWMDSAFSGSPAALAMQALGAREPSAEELVELKAMIARLDRSGSKP